MTPPQLLDRIEDYLARVPLEDSDPEEVGPFTLFRPRGGTPYYARPRLGAADITPDDLVKLEARCAELGLPVAVEWVVERCPSLAPAARRARYVVEERPLLALPRDVAVNWPAAQPGATIERVPAHPARVLPARAVASVAFRTPGTAIAPAGVAARRAAEASFSATRLHDLVDRMGRGFTVLLELRDPDGEVVASGQYQRLGDVAEIVAVATLPSHRRRGHAAALTAALATAARAEGVDLILLSAQDDNVARIYERVGFIRAGQTGSAEPITS